MVLLSVLRDDEWRLRQWRAAGCRGRAFLPVVGVQELSQQRLESVGNADEPQVGRMDALLVGICVGRPEKFESVHKMQVAISRIDQLARSAGHHAAHMPGKLGVAAVEELSGGKDGRDRHQRHPSILQ